MGDPYSGAPPSSSATVPATEVGSGAHTGFPSGAIDGHAPTMGASQVGPAQTGHGYDSTVGGTSGTPYGAPATPLAPGTHVAGQYVVQSVLGRGGMGIVYRAHHLSLERAVALKLHGGGGGGSGSSTETARLEREAKAMARLNHPNVIGVYDVGTHEGNLFIALELVEGGTLDHACGGRPWQGVLQLYLQAAEGLAAAHEAGLVHRDFKPANVLVGRDGRVRVADFGLARNAGPGGSGADVSALSGSLEQLTATGAMVGTPRYMAPEQFGGGRVDARADQFSFCVALYEALWGRPPFAATTAGELLFVMTTDGPAPPPPSDVPPAIWDALRRGLLAKPEQRFESMRALMRALQSSPSRRKNSPLPVVLGIAAVVLLAGGIGSWLVLADPDDDDDDDDDAVVTKLAEAEPEPSPERTPEPPPDPTPAPEVPDPVPSPAAELERGPAADAVSGAPNAPPNAPVNAPPTPPADPGAQKQALSELSDTNMFEDPLAAYAQADQAAAGGASDLSIAGALLEGIMPEDAAKAAPREPAWDQTKTLTCGAGDNLVIRDATIVIAEGEGPAFAAKNGCILRIEGGTITADVIVQTQHAKSVELNKATVTARNTVVHAKHSKVTLRELTMTEPAGETAVLSLHSRILVVDSDLKGKTAVDAHGESAIELEGGSIEGRETAAIARHAASIRTDGTTIRGETKEVSTGTIEVRR